jgi:hypothetical protein
MIKSQQFFTIRGSFFMVIDSYTNFALLLIALAFLRQNCNSISSKILYLDEGSSAIRLIDTALSGTGIIKENRILDTFFPFASLIMMFVRCGVLNDDIGAK